MPRSFARRALRSSPAQPWPHPRSAAAPPQSARDPSPRKAGLHGRWARWIATSPQAGPRGRSSRTIARPQSRAAGGALSRRPERLLPADHAALRAAAGRHHAAQRCVQEVVPPWEAGSIMAGPTGDNVRRKADRRRGPKLLGSTVLADPLLDGKPPAELKANLADLKSAEKLIGLIADTGVIAAAEVREPRPTLKGSGAGGRRAGRRRQPARRGRAGIARRPVVPDHRARRPATKASR